MFFYKDGVKDKSIKKEGFEHVKEVDEFILNKVKNTCRHCTKLIYDTINNPIKKEYVDGGKLIKYENSTFYYDMDTKKFYSQYAWKDVQSENYVHIGVKKDDGS